MRTRRLLAAIFVVLMLLSSCADKPDVRADTRQGAKEEIAIAFIESGETSVLTGADGDAKRATREFCLSHGLRFIELAVTGQNDASRDAAVRSAVSEGAAAVVCTGYFASRVVLVTGKEYPEVSFLCIDTVAPEAELDEYVPKNVHFVVPDYADAGYLAGRVSAKYAKTPAFSAMMRMDSVLDCLSGYVQGISEGADGAEILVSVDAGHGTDGTGRLMTEVASDLLYERGADAVTAFGALIYPCSVAAKAHAANYISVFDTSYDASSRLPSPVFDAASSVTSCLGRLYSGGMKWGARDAGTCTEEGIAEGAITLFGDDGLFDTVKSGVDSGTLKIKRAGTFDEIGADNVKITYITDTEDLYEGS